MDNVFVVFPIEPTGGGLSRTGRDVRVVVSLSRPSPRDSVMSSPRSSRPVLHIFGKQRAADSVVEENSPKKEKINTETKRAKQKISLNLVG